MQPWQQLLEDFHSLAAHVRRLRRHAGNIATGSSKAWHKSGRDWVPADTHDDWNGLRRGEGRARRLAVARHDDIDRHSNKAQRQLGKIAATLGSTDLDDDVPTFDVPEFVEASAKRREARVLACMP